MSLQIAAAACGESRKHQMASVSQGQLPFVMMGTWSVDDLLQANAVGH